MYEIVGLGATPLSLAWLTMGIVGCQAVHREDVMRKRDGVGGFLVLLVLVAMIVVVLGAVVFGLSVVLNHLPRH